MALSARETNRKAQVKTLTKELSAAKKTAASANKAAVANKAVDRLAAALEKKQAAA